MTNKTVRTRYAPSPTGYCHIGGLRTALFQYLFAKKNNGSFILRFEDTDIKRNIYESTKCHYDSLVWAKCPPDESHFNPGPTPPYLQSLKLPIYKSHLENLIKNNKAYFCFCTHKELEEEKALLKSKGLPPKYSKKCRNLSPEQIQQNLSNNIPKTIRLKLDSSIESYHWVDLIYGPITITNNSMTDLIIARSNWIPTYNFAVVIDDYDMKITHVMRGSEHINNTATQIALYKSLGWNSSIPQFGHFPVIVDKNGQKISKRNHEELQYADQFKSNGYIPEALSNFLMFLGWSPENNKEILSIAEAIELFDIKRVSKSPSFFDLNKLNWYNSQYIKRMTDQEYLDFFYPFLTIDLKDLSHLKPKLLLSVKDKLQYGKELNTLIPTLWGINQDQQELIKENSDLLSKCNNLHKTTLSLLDKLEDSSQSSFSSLIKDLKTITKLPPPILLKSLRLSLINQTQGFDLLTILTTLGKDLSHSRISSFLSSKDKNDSLI